MNMTVQKTYHEYQWLQISHVDYFGRNESKCSDNISIRNYQDCPIWLSVLNGNFKATRSLNRMLRRWLCMNMNFGIKFEEFFVENEA